MGLDATVWADDEYKVELASLRVGNISQVGALRNEVAAHSNIYPLLSGRVLYDGIHCGDEITANEVEVLQAELRQLPKGSADLHQFRLDFLELCDVALTHGRAINF